jgi:twitching motility protein PilT
MGTNLRIQETIRMGESEGKSFYEIIEASYAVRLATFDHAAIEAYEQGKITEETALLYCTKRGVVTRGIDNMRKARGEVTSDVGSLRMKGGVEALGGSQTRRPRARRPQNQISLYERSIRIPRRQ